MNVSPFLRALVDATSLVWRGPHGMLDDAWLQYCGGAPRPAPLLSIHVYPDGLYVLMARAGQSRPLAEIRRLPGARAATTVLERAGNRVGEALDRVLGPLFDDDDTD